MADNKPDDNNKKDIWHKRPKPEGPPDLDELMNKLQHKLNSLFRGKKRKISLVGGDGSGSKPSSLPGFGLFSVVILIILVLWALSGIFIVSPAERAAVLRFGKYEATVGPGPHWIPRFVESRYVVNVQRVATYPYNSEMLTKDENIVSVAVAVQYRIDNVRNYLFNVTDPDASLQQATASALRQVVGHTTLDDILTTGRELVREQVTKQLNSILARYHTGIVVTDVALQPAKPPESVTEAFDDVNKAREDEQRYINQARAYQQKVVPIAEGRASRIMQAADAYRQQVILNASADTAKYLALLPQYERAPRVTRERLYLNAIESVLKQSSKILVDAPSGNVMYLPLDQLMRQGAVPAKLPAGANSGAGTNQALLKSANESMDSGVGSSRPGRAGYSDTGGSY
ncbi:MAG: FtsH protease activity modulator HflK [Gammaproteobacteria bacterium]|nr:FtsH protease activity modulator HflK [Gammaproteobacteria bacterium]